MKDDRVYLAENNPDHVLLTLRVPRKNDVNNGVMVAHDGAEELDRLLGADAPPNLVMLDLKLTKVHSLEVLGRLREHDRLRCPPVVLFISCEGGHEASAEAAMLGTEFCLPKGIDFERFSREVRRKKSQLADTNLCLSSRALHADPVTYDMHLGRRLVVKR